MKPRGVETGSVADDKRYESRASSSIELLQGLLDTDSRFVYRDRRHQRAMVDGYLCGSYYPDKTAFAKIWVGLSDKGLLPDNRCCNEMTQHQRMMLSILAEDLSQGCS